LSCGFVQLLRGIWVDIGICPTNRGTSLDAKLLRSTISRAEGFETDIIDMV
jgi:hypothetical protein